VWLWIDVDLFICCDSENLLSGLWKVLIFSGMDRCLIVFEFVWLWIDVDLFAAGNVVCSWGRGEDGQLGHGDTDDRLLPTQLSALDAQQIVSVVCGADHTLAYSESKVEVFSWGWYTYSIFFSCFFEVHITKKMHPFLFYCYNL